MTDVRVDVVNPSAADGAVFIAFTPKGAKGLGSVLGFAVGVNDKVKVDARVYRKVVTKLVANKVAVLDYAALGSW